MRKAPVLLLVCVLAVVGCSSMRKVLPMRKERVDAEQVKELRQRVVELQRRATMSEVEVERLRRQVAELEAAQQDPEVVSAPVSVTRVPEVWSPEESASGQPGAELANAIVIEELPLEDEDLEPAETLPGRDPVDVDPGSLIPEPVVVADEADGKLSVSEDGQALYDRGYTLFHRGKYLDSETVFQQFLGSFSATDLGDNAQFWIGEARFARKDLSGAMAAFSEVVSRYPEGNKVPDALLKVGECQQGLGDLEGARRSYQSVVDRFPLAVAAAVAEDRLRELP